jgi:hypothetical protein
MPPHVGVQAVFRDQVEQPGDFPDDCVNSSVGGGKW